MGRGGSYRITADGVLILSGQPVYVYGMHIVSGNTSGTVRLRGGTVVGDPIKVQETGVTLEGATFDYGQGHYFPDGCYVDVDANVTSVDVRAELVR